MSTDRAEKSGFAAEAQQKIMSKYDSDLAAKLLEWIETVTKQPLENKSGDMDNFVAQLKDGTVLCGLANGLKPNAIPKFNKTKLAFKQMENISFFLKFLEEQGEVPKTEQFQVVDLFEGQDPNSVIVALSSLARKTERLFSVPGFGPKETKANKRDWTNEQLRAGDAIIGLQAGSNKGASQAGSTCPGMTRHM